MPPLDSQLSQPIGEKGYLFPGCTDSASRDYVPSSSRRLLEDNEEAAIIVRRGHTTITNGDFEGLDLVINVQGGTISIAESNFRQNRDSIYVTNGLISIANTNFRASRGTAIHVVGGNVVLKNKTLVEARPNQPALNISNGGLVRYELPASL